tara:strand:+ start:197 stop:391 length:195 start_codon:yes stop_codon:yes gene_type:complete
MLEEIRTNLRRALKRQKDEMGFNLAALRVIGSQMEQKGVKNYVDEDTWDKEKEGKKKRGFVQIA